MDLIEPGDLELRGVRKQFGGTVAVDGIDLTLGRGELVALLGPSGCGKTTTLRIVAGFERADAGTVWIRGRDATAVPAHRRDIGIVFQNYALFPHMTVFENVAYGLRRRRVGRAEIARRVNETLEMVHLAGYGSRHPRELSGGQQQRVAVARAVIIRPSILLLDEPLSNLDAKLRHIMRGELRQLQRALGITALFVTHDQDEALALADRVAVMDAGRIEQIGRAEEVYRRPRNRFVATFVGDCNFLEGRAIAASGSEARFAIGPASVRVALDGDLGAIPASGTAGTLAVRPEDIRLLQLEDPVPSGANVVEGKLRDSVYLGSRHHYHLVLNGGAELLVHRQREPGKAFQVGEAVMACWDPADSVFYHGPG